MWPYPTYKPISWDKYYAQSIHQKHSSITSGLAAGITIGVFFTVFLLTFVCRLYSRRSDSNHSSRRSRRLIHSELFVCGDGSSAEPPPPYEVAIRMPKPGPIEPPPFTTSPTHSDSYSTPISILTPSMFSNTNLNYPPPILAENSGPDGEPPRRSISPPPNIFEKNGIP